MANMLGEGNNSVYLGTFFREVFKVKHLLCVPHMVEEARELPGPLV